MDPYSQPGLNSLRDIQLPDAVPWWPPGPAWWLLGLVLLCLLLLLLYRWHRRRALRRAALQELAWIREHAEAGGSPQRIAMDLSMLLRRVALVRMPEHQPAGLTGERWLTFLDGYSGADSPFCDGVGSILVSAPYAPDTDFDQRPLLLLVEQWIRENT